MASRATDEKVIIAEELEIVRENLQKLDDSLLAPMVLRYFCDLNSIGQLKNTCKNKKPGCNFNQLRVICIETGNIIREKN